MHESASSELISIENGSAGVVPPVCGHELSLHTEMLHVLLPGSGHLRDHQEGDMGFLRNPRRSFESCR